MTPLLSRRLTLSVVTLAVLMAGTTVAILAFAGNTQARLEPDTVIQQSAGLVATMTAIAAGAVIVWHRPRNWIGWGLLLAVLALFSLFGSVYAGFAHPRGLPLAVPIAVVAAAVYLPALTGIVILFACFPNERPRSWVGRSLIATSGAAGAVAFLHELVLPGDVYNLRALGVENPLGVERLGSLPTWDIANGIITGAITLAAVGLVIRAVRSTGLARKQFSWLALVVGIEIAVKLAGVPEALDDFVLAMAPVAVVIAVMKYRLYAIDRILNRTLVYSTVSVVLAIVFAFFVVVPQWLVVGASQTDTTAVGIIALATLLASTVFNPLRRRVQTAVDRRFDRTRYDAEQVVATLHDQLATPRDLDNLVEEVAAVVGRSLAPSSIGVWTPGDRP